jgi:hypothetical protein
MKTLATGIAGLFLLGAGGILNAAETVLPLHYKLPPARSLIGTWKTPLYVTYHIQTDFSTYELEDVATEKRKVTWIITKGPNEKTVNIQQTFRSKDFTPLHPEWGATGYTPDVSPTFLIGKISGTRMTVRDGSGHKYGTFTFTTHHMQGIWDDEWTMAFSQRVYTVKKELKLIKK